MVCQRNGIRVYVGQIHLPSSQLLVIDILYLAYIQATYSTSQTALIATHIDKRDKGEAEDGEAEFECIDDGDA